MNFSQTCTKLSQYLKENKGTLAFGDLNREVNQINDAVTTKTMDLFPHKSVPVVKEHFHTDSQSSAYKFEPETSSQMTIFYGGKVFIIYGFPEDKASELMLLARNSMQNPIEPTNSTISTTNITNNKIQDCAESSTRPNVTYLPIARKNSLTRFLEKRKERIIARAPYAKPVETKSWLEMAAQGPVHLELQLSIQQDYFLNFSYYIKCSKSSRPYSPM